MKRIATLVLAALLVLSSLPALAERLVSTVSNDTIEVSSSFDGETLTLFGSIEAEVGQPRDSVQPPYHVIIVVAGPNQDRVARKKTDDVGVWINTEQVMFKNLPSYYRVLSSGRLSTITSAATLADQGIPPAVQVDRAAQGDWWGAAIFGRELVRLLTDAGLYGVAEGGVNFLSPTTYTAKLNLPNNITNGPFIATTYLFKDGAIVAKRTEGFSVRKVGFERFLGTSAVQYPLLYGLVCVILALFTGWLGGVVFKR